MKKTSYIVRWQSNGERGFGSSIAAQRFIDAVCMKVAPDHDYGIAEEF